MAWFIGIYMSTRSSTSGAGGGYHDQVGEDIKT